MIFWIPYCWTCICFTQMLFYGIWCNHVAESCKILECLILNPYSHPWNELHKPDRTNFLSKRADEGEMEKTSYFSGFWRTGDTAGKIRGIRRIQIFLHNLRYTVYTGKYLILFYIPFFQKIDCVLAIVRQGVIVCMSRRAKDTGVKNKSVHKKTRFYNEKVTLWVW